MKILKTLTDFVDDAKQFYVSVLQSMLRNSPVTALVVAIGNAIGFEMTIYSFMSYIYE